jgi:UDP-3-O-[3-hydroxymyristoyl] glucosamine N-acyltransferase
VALTAGQVARLVEGELIGRAEVVLDAVAPLDRAGPADLALLAASRYLPLLDGSGAGALLVTREFRAVTAGPATRIVVASAPRALRLVLDVLHPAPAPAWGIHPTAGVGRGTRWEGRVAIEAHAGIGADVRLGTDCVVGAHAVIGDGVRMGAGCRIGAHAVLHARTMLGDRAVIHPGARVGGEGFGFTPQSDGARRLPHVGRCRIGDDVEIGANSTVDRGSIGDTVIGSGTKVDNLVQIAHNVRIGARCIIMAQAGLAGSTTIEDDVVLAGQAGLAGHLTVHRGARVAAQAGVIGDVAAGETVSGYPARSHRDVLRQAAALRRLSPLVPQLERMVHHDANRER